MKWWPTVDDQRRSTFTLASGAAAIADPDEWDDATHLKGLFNTYLTTAPIDVAGQGANTLVVAFDSSWRPEGHDDTGASFPVDENGAALNNQTAAVSAQWQRRSRRSFALGLIVGQRILQGRRRLAQRVRHG